MSNSSIVSPQSSVLRLVYWLIISGLGVIAAIFYDYQNHLQGLGGEIALPKLLWLAYALFFWYFLPLLIIADARVSKRWRQVYLVFWVNMILRAVVELWMMYVSINWHPYYGISHDLFNAVLIFGLLRWAGAATNLDGIAAFNLKSMGLLCLIEAYFAGYFLQNVWTEDNPVYFVPNSGDYVWILVATWVVVVGLTIQQLVFVRKWLYAPSQS